MFGWFRKKKMPEYRILLADKQAIARNLRLKKKEMSYGALQVERFSRNGWYHVVLVNNEGNEPSQFFADTSYIDYDRPHKYTVLFDTVEDAEAAIKLVRLLVKSEEEKREKELRYREETAVYIFED